MTESEVIEILNDITFQDCGRYPYGTMPKVRDMAIKALEKQEKIKKTINAWEGGLVDEIRQILRSDEE